MVKPVVRCTVCGSSTELVLSVSVRGAFAGNAERAGATARREGCGTRKRNSRSTNDWKIFCALRHSCGRLTGKGLLGIVQGYADRAS